MSELRDLIRKMPKLEMHIHIEGTFDKKMVCRLAESQGIPLPKPEESLFSFNGLSDFLSMLDWNCSLVRDKETVKELARHFTEYVAEEGIVYTEVIVNPSHWKNIGIGDLVGGLIEGFDEAQEKGLPDCRILVSLRREQELDSASRIVEWILSHRHPRVVGLSIDGNEELSAVSNQKFAPLFAKCKTAGLGITVHAGESSGPEGVVEALDLLGADRIDHGVRSVESPELMRRLHDERIPLDVCFSSNILCDLYTPEAHPIKKLYDNGILVNASTDDPHLFQISLTDELERIALQFGCDFFQYRRKHLAWSAPCRKKVNQYQRFLFRDFIKFSFIYNFHS